MAHPLDYQTPMTRRDRLSALEFWGTFAAHGVLGVSVDTFTMNEWNRGHYLDGGGFALGCWSLGVLVPVLWMLRRGAPSLMSWRFVQLIPGLAGLGGPFAALLLYEAL